MIELHHTEMARPLAESVLDLIGETPLVHLGRLFDDEAFTVWAKLDFLNPFGSSKDRVALYVIEQLLLQRVLKPGDQIVESSSGNLAIALACTAAFFDLGVTCVVDRTVAPINLALLRQHAVTVEQVSAQAGETPLAARLRRVSEIVDERPGTFWINQYANRLCWKAHEVTTAAELLEQAPSAPDWLAIAVSTTATLKGIASRLRNQWPDLKVAAVDARGSAVFGGPALDRQLPGLGSGRQSQLLSRADVDALYEIDEDQTISCCRQLYQREGILAGASSGAIIAALKP